MEIDDRRVAYKTDSGYWILKAGQQRSYTIIRLIEEGDGIRSFDDYDLVRENKKAAFIDLAKTYQFAVDALAEHSRKDAENYKGEYVLMTRDECTVEMKERLTKILLLTPVP